MIRFIAFAFALAVATSAQAMSPAPLHQPDGRITQVREACGAGMHMVNGECILHPPAAMSAVASSQATEQSKKPDGALASWGF